MGKEHEIFIGETCEHCTNGKFVEPKSNHPSYVECSNCQAIKLTYLPAPYQEELHNSALYKDELGRTKIQILAVFGGFGSGKSKASLQEVFLRALESPGGTGLLLAQTLPQLRKTTMKTLIEEIIPPPLVENFNKSELELKLVNGFRFYFIASDEEEKIRSINAGIVHAEEISGIKQSIYSQLLTRMRDPFTPNRLIVACSNPSNTWIRDIFVDNDKRKDPNHPEHEDYNPYISTFIWKTSLNKYLPSDFIEMNTKGKPKWYIERMFNGSFDYNSGMVYPEINDCIIDPFPVVEGTTDKYGIPLKWERFVSLDHGIRNATAVVFGAIDPEKGEVIIYNEYYEPNKLVPEHVKTIKPLIEEVPIGRMRFMTIDPSTKNRTDVINGKSVQGIYQEYGLFFQDGNNNWEAGVLKVGSYVALKKLKIYNTVRNGLKELINYRYTDEDMDNLDKNLDERPIKANDHFCDALRYALMRLPDDPTSLVTESAEPSYRSMNIRHEVANDYQWVQPKHTEDVEEEWQEFSDYMDYV